VLERVNPLQTISLRKISLPEKWVPGFTQGVFSLAKRAIHIRLPNERIYVVSMEPHQIEFIFK